MKVEAAIATALIAEGVSAASPVFGVMGDGNMGLWAELASRSPDGEAAIRTAWHEAAALGMADGFSRVHRDSRRPGIATVTCGPGLTHAATSLVAAVRHGSALLVLAGSVPPGQRGSAQALDQRRFSEACSARFAQLTSRDRLADDLHAAFALAQREPLVLDLPMDLLEQEVPAGWHYARATPPEPAELPAPDPGALLDALSRARRPVILAGLGAIGARDALLALADRLGALLATSLPAKGLFAGSPRDIGIAGGFSSNAAARCFAEADLVLAVGATLGDFTTRNGTLFPHARMARINLRPAEGTLDVQGDARMVATALLARLEGNREGWPPFRDEPAAAAQPADGVDPRALMRALSAALPARTGITCGVGHFWGFPVAELSLPPGGRIGFAYDFGAIGQGLAFAIGAGIADPTRPNLLIEGDGSLMQGIQELETAARCGPPLVVLVMNDGGYGAERHKLVSKGFRGALADWPATDFVAIARAFGGDGARLDAAEEIGPLLRRGLDGGGLFVIDARVSPSVLSDAYQRALGRQ